jgi:FkbM family methyltransferase
LAQTILDRGTRAVLSVLPPRVAWFLQRTLFPIPGVGRALKLLSSSAAVGEAVIRNGPARGLRIDATGTLFSFALGTCDPDEQAFLVEQLRAGGVFYDLGANVGFFSLLAARLVGPTGHVVAFEPSPANAAQWRRNIAMNGFANATLVEAAVSSEPGAGRLDVATPARGEHRLVRDDDGAREGLVAVRLVSVDGYRADAGLPMPDAIKVDVEGAEIDALRGAHATIREARPAVLVEVHTGVGPRFAEYFEDELAPLGYRASELGGGAMRTSTRRHHVVLLPDGELAPSP